MHTSLNFIRRNCTTATPRTDSVTFNYIVRPAGAAVEPRSPAFRQIDHGDGALKIADERKQKEIMVSDCEIRRTQLCGASLILLSCGSSLETRSLVRC